ncbi:unnamed protein product [Closterium sp. NIES-65]|nr:unnamed protein product [Closterium sp. NIES-65]
MAESYCNRARTIRAELLTIGQEVHMATFAAHVLKGLPPEYGFLRRKLEISSPDMTVERVCSKVLMEEQTLSIEQSYKQITSDASAFSGAVNTTVATTGINGKEGKGRREQTDKKKDGKREKKRALFKGRCYNGNEEGHMAAKCPNKKKDTMPAAAANVAEGDGKGVALTVACSAAKLLADDKDLWTSKERCNGCSGMQRHGGCNGMHLQWRVERRATARGLHRHATASNGTAKEIADVASSKPEAKDGAASLKMYAVGSKATPNLWHARLGHVLRCGEADSHERWRVRIRRHHVPSSWSQYRLCKGARNPFERSVGPLGSKAPTAPPPLGPPSIADSAPVGPEDGPLEVDTSMADYEEEEEVAVDEQSPMAHEHEPSPAVPPFQPIPPPPRRSSRPNKGVPPVRFQPSAMMALDADDEDNPYDVAYLAEDECDTDSDDEVEYPDADEEEEGAWGGVILDLAAALTGPEGKELWAAMKEEMESLDEQGTWTLADLPEGRKTGYKKSLVDQALYYKDGASGKRVWLLIYVDDLLAASEDQQLLQDLKGLLAKAFQLREVEPVERYLGLQIEQDRPNRTLFLHQNAYVAKVQQRFFKGAPPKKQPITPLSSASFAKQDARQFTNRTMTEFLSILGMVQFAAIATRPNLSFACSRLAAGAYLRTNAHWHELFRTLSYWAASPDKGGPESLTLVGTDWG